jgi:hypothetical protein
MAVFACVFSILFGWGVGVLFLSIHYFSNGEFPLWPAPVAAVLVTIVSMRILR